MANFRIATTPRNSMLTALRDALDGGTGAAIVRIYSGTQPTNADTALAGNTLLAQLTCSDPSGGSPSSGTLTLSSITEDSSADATGTATFARVLQSDGTTVIFDCDVSTSGATINLNTTSIVSGGPVRITNFTISIPAA